MGTASDGWINAGRLVALYSLGVASAGVIGVALDRVVKGADSLPARRGGVRGVGQLHPILATASAHDELGRIGEAARLDRDVLGKHDVARLVGDAIATCLTESSTMRGRATGRFPAVDDAELEKVGEGARVSHLSSGSPASTA